VEPKILTIPEKKFAGKRLRMSLAENRTRELWQSFMPQRNEIKNRIDQKLYSIELYAPHYFDNFDPQKEFEKWAAVEVTGFMSIPEGFETIISPIGLYACFLYKGASSAASETYRYIFGSWLPASDFAPDDRPHFAVMGEKYKNDDPDSEEELWIPIKNKYIY
jgi:AraC family transcriptional regulator